MHCYCPHCWGDLREDTTCCPQCGYDLAEYENLSYEDKFLLALDHPVRENRMMAIDVLGKLGEFRALPAFRRISAASRDFHEVQAVIQALLLIGGAKSETIILELESHPSRLVAELARPVSRDGRKALPFQRCDLRPLILQPRH